MRSVVKRLMRALLVLLVVAGVPVQGFAALGGGLCGVLGHHAAKAVPVSGAFDHAQADHHGKAGGGQSVPGEAFCPACASCGVAAAMAVAPAVFAPTAAGGEVAAADSPAPPGFVPEGLDRPPLAFLS